MNKTTISLAPPVYLINIDPAPAADPHRLHEAVAKDAAPVLGMVLAHGLAAESEKINSK
jgi:hypothetical protein